MTIVTVITQQLRHKEDCHCDDRSSSDTEDCADHSRAVQTQRTVVTAAAQFKHKEDCGHYSSAVQT